VEIAVAAFWTSWLRLRRLHMRHLFIALAGLMVFAGFADLAYPQRASEDEVIAPVGCRIVKGPYCSTARDCNSRHLRISAQLSYRGACPAPGAWQVVVCCYAGHPYAGAHTTCSRCRGDCGREGRECSEATRSANVTFERGQELRQECRRRMLECVAKCNLTLRSCFNDPQ
jgi:hypothetical protein